MEGIPARENGNPLKLKNDVPIWGSKWVVGGF